MTSSLPPTHTMRSPQFSPARLRSFLAAIIALLFVAAPTTQAQQTWNNNSSAKNWSNSASTWNSSDWWANPGGTLVFTNAGSGNVTNNMTDWTDFGSIIFRTNAASFNISGNSIGLTNTPKIENYSANSQTISIANLALRQAAEFNPIGGDLTINSLNVYLDGFALSVWGDNGRTLTFGSSTIIAGTGAGSTLSINQNSTVLFQSAHTYAGDTSINAGTLRIASGGSANNSTFRIGASSGSASATLRINGGVTVGGTGDIVARSGTSGTRTITTDAASGITATVSRNVYLDAGLTVSSTTTGGTLAFTSTTFDIKSQTLAFTGAGNFSISSALTSSTSGGNFTKAGAGTLTLSGSSANTFVGSSTVSEGVLILNKTANTAAIDGSLTINSGATLRTDAANQLNNELVTVNGTFNLNDRAQSLALAGSGSVTLGSATITINNAGNDSFTGGISGTGGLIKTGAGTQALSSANSYSGKVQINQGVLSIGAESALGGTVASLTADQLQFGGGTLAVTNGFTMSSNRGITLNSGGGTIEVTNGQTLTYGGLLTGASGNNFTKTGAGGLTLSANNSSSLAGSFRILGGTVTITNVNSLGSGVLELGATATQGVLVVNSNNTRSQNILITDNSTNSVINVASGQALTTTGSLTQGGTFANTTKFGKAGSGTLILAGSSGNTYNGQIQIGDGTVIAGTSTALGTNNGTGQRAIDLGLDISDAVSANNVALLASNGVTVGNSFFVAGNGGTRTIGLAGSGSATFSNQFFMNGNLIVDAGSGASDSVTISGNLTNSGGIIKTNAGILVLSASNNHSGGTTLGQGTLRINDARALGSGTFTISGPSTIDNTSGAAITLANNNAQSWNADFTFAGTTNLNLGTGAVTLGASRQVTVSANNLTVGGIISGSGFGLTKAGAGTLTLSGANTFSGTTTISGGVLSVGAATNLGASPVSIVTNQLTINGGALATTAGMTLVNRGITVGSSGGTINVGSGVGLTNTAGLYGSGALAKTGSGTLALTNTSGSYSGTITVSDGALQANTASSLSSANVTVGTTGTLLGGATLGTVVINSGGTIAPGNGSGSIGNLASSALTLNGGGSYRWELTSVTGTAGTNWDLITVGSSGGGVITLGANSGSKFTINIVGTNPTGWNSATDGAWDIIDAGSWSSAFDSDAFAFDTSQLSVSGTLGTWGVSNNAGNLRLLYSAPGVTWVFNNSAAANQGAANTTTNGNGTDVLATITNTGSAATAVVISNTAPMTFTNVNNSYSGSTTIERGTLVTTVNSSATGNGAFGSNSTAIALGASTTAADATLLIGASGVDVGRAVTVAAGVSGARTIGATNASGTATYSGAITMNTNTTLSASNSGGTTLFSGAIGGSGAITAAGSGTVTLSGANTYTNTTTVNSGATLVAANNTALGGGSGATTVNNGGTLAFSNNINEDEVISISGTGVGGNGALRNLSGANTNTGTVSLSGATNLVGVDAGTSLRLGTVDAGSGTRGFTANVATNGSLLVTGGILNGSGNITNVLQKDGTGSMIVSNNGTTGGMQLQVGNGSFTLAAGSFSTNTSTDGGSTSPRAIDLGIGSSGDSTGDAAFYARSGVTVSNSIYVAPAGAGGAGTRTLGTESTSGTVTYNNQIYLGTGSILQVASADTANVVLSGNITNDIGTPGASATLTKIGLGTLTLSASNDWRGSFIVGAGTAILNSANTIRDSAAVTVSNAASLNLNFTEEVGSISGLGNISLAVNQFRAGGNGANTTFSGIMSSSSDAATFVKKGAGTLTLAGANTMNGQSYLTAGTTLFTVNQGGTFTNILNLGETSGADDAILAVGGSGVTLANPILVRGGSSNNTLTISALNISGTSTLTGGITLNRDLTISANSGGNLLITTNALVMNGSGNNSVTVTGSNNVTIASMITAPSGASQLTTSGTGTTTLSGNNSANFLKLILNSGTLSVSSLTNIGQVGGSYNDKINFNGGTLLVTEDMTIAPSTFGMTASASGGTINVASGKTFTQNAAFSSGNASGAFNKTGSGTLVLGDAGNQINPIFNIREGTVSVASTGALGAGGTNVTLGDTSTAGTLLFTGSSATTGRAFTVNAGGGTINVSNATTELTLTTNAVFNGTFTKAGQGTLILGNTSSGTGRVSIDAGTLSVAAAGNLGGATGSNAVTLNGGTLRTTANMNLGNRGVTVASTGGTISVQSGTSLTQTNGLFGTGNLTKDGSGLLHLTNTNTSADYAGALTVTNGTLQVNTTVRGANISVGHSSSNAGSVLMGAGSVGTVAIGNNGRISPGNSVGILSVSNLLSFNSGGSYLWEISNTNGIAGTDWDLISVDTAAVNDGLGTLNINGAFTIAGTNIGAFTFNTQTNYPAFQIVRATTLGGTGSLGDLSFSSLGTSLGASGNWAFSFTNGSGLYATYSAPTASLVFTNNSALTQGAANLVTNNNAGDLATITNQGGVTAVVISNTAPVTFTNDANTYSGATTIERGTLATIVNAGNTTGAFGSNAAAINLGATSGVADATLLIGAAGVTVSKAVDVRGGGSGVRTIGATNTSGVATYSGGIALATNVTLSASNSGATTLFSGAISGTTGNLTASGSGVVVLSGANTFSGTTTVSNGATLVAANNAALGNTTGNTIVSSNSTLALSNNISTAENISIAGSGVGDSGGALRNLSGNNTNTGTITLSANATISADAGTSLQLGNIDVTASNRQLSIVNEGTVVLTGNFLNMGTSATFFKNGSGSLVISNTSANTGGGQLQVGAGSVTLAAGTFSTNTLTDPRGLDLGFTATGGASTNSTAFYVNQGVTMSNTVYVAGGTGARIMGTESTAGTATFTGEIYLDNNLTLTAATNGTANFAGSIVNTNGNLTKAGNGTVILSGANTFTGNVDITAGRLNAANSSAIGNSAAVTVSNGATFGVSSLEEIGSLAGGGFVSLNSLLIAGGNGASTTYSGEMRNGGGFVKKGTGVMTLSGASIATGETYIVNGTLLFAANQGGTFTNTVNLGETFGADSATLALTNGITLANPLTVRGGSSNNLLTVANLSTSGTTTLSGNVILSNTTTLSSIAGGNVAFTGGTMSFAGSTALNVTNTGNVSIANSISAAGNALIAKRGSGTVTLSATNNAGNVRYDLYGGELQVGSTGAIGNQTGSFLPNKVYFDGGSLGVTGNTTLGGDDGIVLGGGGGTIRVGSGATLTLQGYIQDEARTGLTLSKTGEGTLFLDKGGNNDLGGTTIVVNQGVLSTYNLDLLSSNVQLGAASGATAGTFNFTKTDGAVTAANNFAVNSGGGAISVTDNTLTLSGAISGSGALSKTSAGTLTLTGNNTYSGALTVSEGTLNLNRAGAQALGSVGSVNVATGATLLISQSNQVNNSAAITLSGGTISRGTGVSEIFGDLNISGGSTLNFGLGAIGDLQFQAYNYTGSALIEVQNFLAGNRLQFLASSFSAGNLSQFDFNGIGVGTSLEGDYFTITAIPEPSTYLAAAGLLAMFLWPMRRRLIKDAKSIFGLRATGRDRSEAYRNA